MSTRRGNVEILPVAPSTAATWPQGAAFSVKPVQDGRVQGIAVAALQAPASPRSGQEADGDRAGPVADAGRVAVSAAARH